MRKQIKLSYVGGLNSDTSDVEKAINIALVRNNGTFKQLTFNQFCQPRYLVMEVD